MADRLEEYLDGSIERAALTSEERRQADAIECAIEETRAFMESPHSPDLTPGVMRQIERLGAHRDALESRGVWRRLADGLWMPRRIDLQVRPVYVVGAVAAVVLLVLVSPYRLQPSRDVTPAVAGAVTEPRIFVRFRFEAPDAVDVRLAGSFTNWQPRYELHRTATGIWTIMLPLSLGVHDYAFVVDGQRWMADPYAQHVDDGFGGSNSRIALLAPDVPRS